MFSKHARELTPEEYQAEIRRFQKEYDQYHHCEGAAHMLTQKLTKEEFLYLQNIVDKALHPFAEAMARAAAEMAPELFVDLSKGEKLVP